MNIHGMIYIHIKTKSQKKLKVVGKKQFVGNKLI